MASVKEAQTLRDDLRSRLAKIDSRPQSCDDALCLPRRMSVVLVRVQLEGFRRVSLRTLDFT